MGVASATPATILGYSFAQCDVIFTPKGNGIGVDDDRAHADLIVKDKTPADVVAFKDLLASSLQFKTKAEIAATEFNS